MKKSKDILINFVFFHLWTKDNENAECDNSLHQKSAIFKQNETSHLSSHNVRACLQVERVTLVLGLL